MDKAGPTGPTRRNDMKYNLARSVFRLFPQFAARYSLRKEYRITRDEAVKSLDAGPALPDGATREDYFKALESNTVSLSEYLHQYQFYNKTQQERDTFISRAQNRALSFKLRMMYPDYDNLLLFMNKEVFLERYSRLGFCHRQWLYAPQATLEQFTRLVCSTSCIIKPHDGSLGRNISKLERQQPGTDLKTLYDDCVARRCMVEECLVGCDEIQAFHPSSLNSIRFVTVAYGGRAVPFGAFVRMGIGDMIIDNAHAGGLYAQINIDTGLIESDGITTDGARCAEHPDTKIKIKGFQMPRWSEVVDFCTDAARQTPNIITGWDVVITRDGQLEFVEANQRPDFDVMQSPLQIGVKKKLLDTLSDLTGRRITI